MEKKEKKGFWASLFSPKPCRCACGEAFVIPTENNGKEPTATPGGAGQDIKEVKVLGPGCAKCKSTYAVVEKAVKASGVDVKLTKVDDIEEIMRYNILATPAIVVDGKVVMKGRVPTVEEVERILGLVN